MNLGKIKDAIDEFSKMVEDCEKKELIGNIKPKYAIGQMVYQINYNKVPSWYSMPVKCESLIDGFEEYEISTIVVGKGKNLDHPECACDGNEEKIVVAYGQSYRDGNMAENQLWGSIEEAIKFNQEKFNIERKKYLKEIEDEKIEKKKRLEREIQDLNKS